jgi:hypothetical protein
MSKTTALRTVYYTVLTQMTATATALLASGTTDAQTAVLVAGGLGVAAGEIGLRLFGRDDDADGPPALVASTA